MYSTEIYIVAFTENISCIVLIVFKFVERYCQVCRSDFKTCINLSLMLRGGRMNSTVPRAQSVKSSGTGRFSFRRSRTSATRKENLPTSPQPLKAVNGNGNGNGVDCSRWLPSRGELEKVFKKFDANSDGQISSSELRGLMASMGQNLGEEEVSSIMKEADSNGDGFISFDEFYEANTKGVNVNRLMKDLERAFKMYDLDKNGLISVQELHKVLQSLGEKSSLQDCHGMINRFDKNADGFISFDEFMTMMSSPHP